MNTVIFLGIDCEVVKQEYRNKQVALQLVAADSETNRSKEIYPGEPIATATSCLTNYTFGENLTAIKNYSENEGILDILAKAKIIQDTGRTASSGFCIFPVVKVLI